MNLVDWTLIGVLIVSAGVGMWRGLVYEVLSVAAWVAAFLVAQTYAAMVASWLPLEGMSPALRTASGFVAVFVACVFAGGLLAWLVSKLVAAVGLRPIDRMLGAAFGLLRGAIVLLAVAVVVGLTPMRDRAGWQDSQLARVLDDSLHTLRPLLPEAVARHLS